MTDLTSADVVTAVRRRYGCETDDLGPEWAALDEMDLQPGWSSRRIDLLMVRAWRGKRGHERHAIEVKVSRSDLRRELDQPDKWGAWAEVTHRYYLAVPADLSLDGIVLPETWGLITVTGAGTKQRRAAAFNHDATDLPQGVFVEAFRRASRAEARIRQSTVDDPAAHIAQLERDVVSLERQAATARRAERRWIDRAMESLALFAEVAPSVVCHCGTVLQLRAGKRAFNPRGIGWDHVGAPGDTGYGPCTYPRPDLDALRAAHLARDEETEEVAS